MAFNQKMIDIVSQKPTDDLEEFVVWDKIIDGNFPCVPLLGIIQFPFGIGVLSIVAWIGLVIVTFGPWSKDFVSQTVSGLVCQPLTSSWLTTLLC